MEQWAQNSRASLPLEDGNSEILDLCLGIVLNWYLGDVPFQVHLRCHSCHGKVRAGSRYEYPGDIKGAGVITFTFAVMAVVAGGAIRHLDSVNGVYVVSATGQTPSLAGTESVSRQRKCRVGASSRRAYQELVRSVGLRTE